MKIARDFAMRCLVAEWRLVIKVAIGSQPGHPVAPLKLSDEDRQEVGPWGQGGHQNSEGSTWGDFFASNTHHHTPKQTQ